MTRETKLFLYGSIAFTGGSFLIYQSIRRNQIYNLLISKIQSETVSIDNKKIVSVLNGLHHTSVNSSKPFVIINEQTKRESSDKLHNAISGGGTNEDAVYAALNQLPDKVAVSQVAAHYQAKNQATLLNDLRDDLNDQELQKAFQIINGKPDIRWTS